MADQEENELGRLLGQLTAKYDLQAPDESEPWRLWGYDTFDRSDYPMGHFARGYDALLYAYHRLQTLDNGGGDGGQLRGGIQDRIYLLCPGGEVHRIFPWWHPMPFYLSERTVAARQTGVVLREADAREAIRFFGRSQWCVVTAGRAWLLHEDPPPSGEGEPRLERAESYDLDLPVYEREPEHVVGRHIVEESAKNALAQLDRAYHEWRKLAEVATAELCFEIVAEDDISVRGASEESDRAAEESP